MIPSIYINLEDDVARIVERIRRHKGSQLVLVCPKRCFLFNDSINLRLLKKQVDLLKKEAFILTMDERGQIYAKEAGFKLKFLPKGSRNRAVSDIRTNAGGKPAQEQSQKLSSPENAETERIPAAQPKAAAKERPEKKQAYAGPAVGTWEPALGSGPDLEPSHEVVAEMDKTDSFFPPEIEEAHQRAQKNSSIQKAIMFLVAISIVTLLALAFVILPKATVLVYPRTEPVTRDLEISMSPNIKNADASKLTMPAVKINETLEIKKKFQSQGKKEVGNKAKGQVVIYNFTRQPLNLKASTTILTVGNKNYVLTSDISQLKPTGYKNASTREVDESTLSAPVEIVAQEGGEGHNLPAGTRMEITNQVFGSRPQFLYAKTSGPISGGTSRYLSVVSEQDLVESQKALTEELVAAKRGELEKEGLVLSDKAYSTEVLEFVADKPVGTETPSFEAVLKAKITGLVFNRLEMQALVHDRVSQTISRNKELPMANIKELSYKVKNMDLGSDLAVLSVHFEGQAVMGVDLQNIAPELTGKTKNQANEILRSKAEIDRIDITLSPSWQSRFPWFAGKIEVKTAQGQPAPE